MPEIELPAAVKDFIRKHSRFLLLGHIEPDGDSVGSQLALASFLRRLGKESHLFCPGPFDRPEIAGFRGSFRDRIEEKHLRNEPAAVIIDCSTPDRVGELGAAINGLESLVIDHHASGRDYGEVRWVVPQAPSVTFLVQLLIEGLGHRPTQEEAELLLFGLCTDTGFFRHLDEKSSEVFSAVARLVEAGASPGVVYRNIYSGQELGKLKLLGRSLAQVETHLGGRLLVTYFTRQDLTASGAEESRGSDELYRLLQTVRDEEVIVFIREESPGFCSVGLRSSTDFDVGSLAQAMGGGGHPKAAGFSMGGSVEEVKDRLLPKLRDALKKQKLS